MKYTIAADTHLFSKYEVPNIRQKVLDQARIVVVPQGITEIEL